MTDAEKLLRSNVRGKHLIEGVIEKYGLTYDLKNLP
jgi:hypothetical protein